MQTTTSEDPFLTLGLPREADEAEVRARYLELVKQFPPDTAPDKFREIRAAFEAARDPLVIASQLIRAPDPDRESPTWKAAIEAQKQIPPKLSVGFLLSMGNRKPNISPPEDAGNLPGTSDIEHKTDNQ